jgi:pilus assembly protein CpaB
MTMKTRRFTLILAVLFALIAGGSVYAFTSSVDQRATLSKEPTEVLVAALQIPAGVSLGNAKAEGMLKTEVFPASTVPAGALKSVDAKNQNLLATAPIQPGSLLRSSDFAVTLNPSSALTLPAGTVAVSVELKDAQRLGTFLVAGSKIALLDNFTAAKGLTQTRVLVSSVLVLAVGGTTNSTGAASGNANLVTVSVSPEDALRIVQAQSTGELWAVMVGDAVPTAGAGVSDSNLFGGIK